MKVFSYYLCLMIEGSEAGAGAGSGSVPHINGSGSGRPKNIPNTAPFFNPILIRVTSFLTYTSPSFFVLPISESIERFIEHQAFLRSHVSAPRPSPSPFPIPPLPSTSCLFFTVVLCVAAGRAYSAERLGAGLGEEPNHTTARKPYPL